MVAPVEMRTRGVTGMGSGLASIVAVVIAAILVVASLAAMALAVLVSIVARLSTMVIASAGRAVAPDARVQQVEAGLRHRTVIDTTAEVTRATVSQSRP
jgi:uncharacterized membrane protein YdbT with pleckstrin-like domain